jgi:hypothetical protein
LQQCAESSCGFCNRPLSSAKHSLTAAIALLGSWLDENENASEHQQSWEFLKTTLDEDRLFDRPLFPCSTLDKSIITNTRMNLILYCHAEMFFSLEVPNRELEQQVGVVTTQKEEKLGD